MKQELTEFILLKAIFNGELSEAIFAKDGVRMIEEVINSYQYEINNGLVEMNGFTNIGYLYAKHIADIEKINEDCTLLHKYIY